MAIEKGKWGLWYSKGTGFATEEQAQAHEDGTDVPKPIPAPKMAAAKVPAIWPGLLVAAAMIIGGVMIVNRGKSSAPAEFGWNAALTMCQSTLRKVSRDPDNADVPYVPDHGSGDEFYFAWGASTKMARMRNGLGLEVPASASCIVSKSQKRITSLTLNGKTII